jgi:hypothetical protein
MSKSANVGVTGHEIAAPAVSSDHSLSAALGKMSDARQSAVVVGPVAGEDATLLSIDQVLGALDAFGDISAAEFLAKAGARYRRHLVRQPEQDRWLGAIGYPVVKQIRLALSEGYASVILGSARAVRYASQSTIVCHCPDDHYIKLSDVRVAGRCNVDGKKLTCG